VVRRTVYEQIRSTKSNCGKLLRMREIIFCIIGLAGSIVWAALAVLIQPGPFWQWTLWTAASIFVLAFVILLADLLRQAVKKKRTQNNLNKPAIPEPGRALRANFSKDIPGCIDKNATLTTSQSLNTQPIYPPNTTLGVSRGSLAFATSEKITLFSIQVAALNAPDIAECRGQLLRVTNADGPHKIDAILPFAPFEERSEANLRHIYNGTPAFLNVFYITETNRIHIKSHMNLPSSVDEKQLFEKIGKYVFTVRVMAPNCESDTIYLLLDWMGEARTAEISLSKIGGWLPS